MLSDMGILALMRVFNKYVACVLLSLLALPALAQNILLVGDSISAAYGLEIEQGWVRMLEQRLAERKQPYTVINASVSGDTTAGGLARLPALLEQHEPALVLIELGGNDGLRALPIDYLQQNLSAMVQLAQQAGAKVILLGMRIPPNYGPRYTDAFERVFGDVADEHSVPLVPFLLEGVGGVDGMIQSDGVHPTAAAQSILLDNVWPKISQWLRSQEGSAQ